MYSPNRWLYYNMALYHCLPRDDQPDDNSALSVLLEIALAIL